MFDGLYAPIPDVEKYLARLGMKLPQKADRSTLDALILAHLRCVPFENLDVYDAQTDLCFDIPYLYDKIVLRRRGGYCFELNALFTRLLQDLGYDCYPVMSRVLWGATFLRPLAHRSAIVTIDGLRYYADVGFGGPSAQSSLLVDDASEQISGPNIFTVDKAPDGGFIISRLVESGSEQLLYISETPCDPVDFLPLSEFQAKNKNSRFTQVRIVSLTTENGSKTLTENLLKINQKDKDAQEKALNSEEEIRAALLEHFGIVVDFPLRKT